MLSPVMKVLKWDCIDVYYIQEIDLLVEVTTSSHFVCQRSHSGRWKAGRTFYFSKEKTLYIIKKKKEKTTTHNSAVNSLGGLLASSTLSL